jgi:hypothetical protein
VFLGALSLLLLPVDNIDYAGVQGCRFSAAMLSIFAQMLAA